MRWISSGGGANRAPGLYRPIRLRVKSDRLLDPTITTLKTHNLLFPAGSPGHIVLFTNDGSAEEYAAIRRGDLDATISQPADMYAKYGLIYLQQAMAGQTFKAGPTDHGSTIVEVSPGVLEDQLSAPLVTKSNVDDKSLWGNQS
jgi:ribose transport system substrate-binding protein